MARSRFRLAGLAPRSAASALVVLALAAVLPARAADGGADAVPRADSHASWWSWDSGIFSFSWGGVSWRGSAETVTGSDKLVNDSRPVEGVKSLVLTGPLDVVLRQGAGRRATVHTDDNLAPLVETVVEDGTLRIRTKAGSSGRSRHPIVVTVEVPTLSSVAIEGSGDIHCAGWDGDVMEATIRGSGDLRIDSLHAQAVAVLLRGSGDVHLSGKVARQGFVIEGSGDVKAHELVGEQVAVKVSGSGDAEVWATQDLTVEINGSGDVHFRGPAKLTQHVHGSGEVVRD